MPTRTTKRPRAASTKTNGATAPADVTANGGGKLVIVESPAKARTLGKYLGRGFSVRASIGLARGPSMSVLGGHDAAY